MELVGMTSHRVLRALFVKRHNSQMVNLQFSKLIKELVESGAVLEDMPDLLRETADEIEEVLLNTR
jgi:hypothetical protein